MINYGKHICTIGFILNGLITPGFAVTLPENHAVNGGVTIIPIDIKQKPDVFFNNSRIAIYPSTTPNQWLLIVGIPLDNNQAIQLLQVTKPYKASIPFHVSNKYYKTQYLTIENKRKVVPLLEDEQRIADETKKMATIFAGYSNRDPFSEGFKAPAYGPISSLFGLKRIYNKEPRPPHSGLDIAAPADSTVRVIDAGKVVDSSDYFFTGNTVIVDHGMGVFSLYGHLKAMDVKIGDTVKQGQQIGLVGMTGRATGPHLHWSMVINQTLVDPLLFVSAHAITTLPTPPKPQKDAVPATS